MPIEEAGACPFEGCAFGRWTASAPVVARASRQTAANRLFIVRKGEAVTAITGVLVIERAGRVEFPGRAELQAREGRLVVPTGEPLYLLGYKGEGYTNAWFNGRTFHDVDGSMFFNALCDTQPDRCSGRIVERPRTVWWVQIKNAAGRLGWTNEADKFDGKDRYGR